MIKGFIRTVSNIFSPHFGSQEVPQIQAPEVIDLTDPAGGSGGNAPEENSRKRKFDDTADVLGAVTNTLKRRRLPMENVDDEEDVKIIPQKETSLIQSIKNFFSPSSWTPKPKARSVSKDDLNTKDIEFVKEVNLAGTFQAAPPTKLESVEPEQVQLIKVVNPNKVERIDLTESQDENDTPTSTGRSSEVSSVISVPLESNQLDNEVQYLGSKHGAQSRVGRVHLFTRKGRQQQRFNNIPANLRSNMKSTTKRSTMSRVFGGPFNMKARNIYSQLLNRQHNSSQFFNPDLYRQRANTSLFQRLEPYNTSIVREAEKIVTNIQGDEDEISVIDSGSPKLSSSHATYKPTPGPSGSKTIKSPGSLLPSSSKSPILTHSTPFVTSKPKESEVITLSRSSSLEDEFKAQAVYSDDFLKKIKEKYGANARDRERKIKEEKLKKEFYTTKNEEMQEALEKRVQNFLKITSAIMEEPKLEEEEEDTTLPEITQDMEQVIRRAYAARDSEPLVNEYRIEICGKDIDTLKGLSWLNDEIINFYLQMIVARSGKDKYPKVYAYNTFFYSTYKDNGFARVKRWTKKVDVFSYDLLLVPVHLGMHWCLATIDVTNKCVNYYDSMGGNNQQCLDLLTKYLQEEHQDKKKSAMDMTNWGREMKKDIPQQMNGSDCGMFTCKFAEYLSRRARITFSQQDMPYFRRRMVYEIVKNDLMKP